jgi:hypothetical protein
MAWGMSYGALWSLAITLATGKALAFEPTIAYVASLLYLTVPAPSSPSLRISRSSGASARREPAISA